MATTTTTTTTTTHESVAVLLRQFKGSPPLSHLVVPLLWPLPSEVVVDCFGNAVLVVRVDLWRTEWSLDDPPSLAQIQWCTWIVVNRMLLENPAAQQGLSILSDASNVPEGVNLDHVHIILTEFIKMTMPVSLNNLYILKLSTPDSEAPQQKPSTTTWVSRFTALSSLVSKSLARSHFLSIMDSWNIQCTTFNSMDSLASVIDVSCLPMDYSATEGALQESDYDEWYQHLKTSMFSSTMIQFINNQELDVLEYYGLLSDEEEGKEDGVNLEHRVHEDGAREVGVREVGVREVGVHEERAGSFSNEKEVDDCDAGDLKTTTSTFNPYNVDPQIQMFAVDSHEDSSMTDSRSVVALNTNDLADTLDLNDLMNIMDQAVLMKQTQIERQQSIHMTASPLDDSTTDSSLNSTQPHLQVQHVMESVSMIDSPLEYSGSGSTISSVKKNTLQRLDSIVKTDSPLEYSPSISIGGTPPPPPPPPPSLAATPSRQHNPVGVEPTIQPGTKILRFKSAVRVHRYEVPPRAEWEKDVWWQDEDGIGELEDWEVELYAGKKGLLIDHDEKGELEA
ncbi:hypothetical protein HDU79_005316 [Rhizoclosmatium sp. JEL0117]|nr:hypothetical protein HDU79_005316 [Rhizoclosmatium sp. JEL0117]